MLSCSMAQKKSKTDVLRNEKYMNDAVDSAMFNLHKIARRKSEFNVWDISKFNSLDSIFVNPIEKQASEALGDASNVNKSPEDNSKCIYSLHVKDSKSTANHIIENEAKTNPANALKNVSHCEKNQRIFASRESLINFQRVKQGKSIFTGSKPEYLNVGSENLVSDIKASTLNGCSQILKSSKKLCDSTVKKIPDRNENMQYSMSDTLRERRHESFQKRQPFRDTTETENCRRKSLGQFEQTSIFSTSGKNVFKESTNASQIMNLNSEESKIYSNYPRNKMINQELHQKEKTIETTKKKIHYLSSSVNSIPLEKKKLPIKNHNEYRSSERLKALSSKTLSLKILKGDEVVFDFILELSEFERIKKKFPKLQEIFPEIDDEQKVIGFSADAVKVIFGFLCNISCEAPDDRTSIEVLAASKSWEINQFHTAFQQMFLTKLNRDNMHINYGAAVYYGLGEICDAYKSVFNDSELHSVIRPYKQRKCYISVSTYIEPREFYIPSKPTGYNTLNDNFDRDIRNEITFQAIAGPYVITGFHILLNLNKIGVYSTHLDFFYLVQNSHNSHIEELKVRKDFSSNIVINLKRNLVVNQYQTAKIVIETSIKPYMCLTIERNCLEVKCYEGQFLINMASNYKVVNSNERRFFIEKLLYYPQT